MLGFEEHRVIKGLRSTASPAFILGASTLAQGVPTADVEAALSLTIEHAREAYSPLDEELPATDIELDPLQGVGATTFRLGSGLDVAGIDPERRGVTAAELRERGRRGLRLGPAFSVNVGELTTLSDGGLGLGSARPEGLEPQTDADRFAPGLVESGRAEFQMYDASLSWAPVAVGPLRVGVAGGMRAVRADLRDDAGSGAADEAFQPIPVVGGDLSLQFSERFRLGGRALTDAVNDTGNVLDLKAEAGITFTPKVGVTIGYQYLESAVDMGPRDAELDQQGPFARLRIRF